jgi:Spy/CpxP family protein refolding chaperone
MADWLNLDATQRDAMRAILDDCLPRILAQRDAGWAARRRAAEQYLKPTVDPDSVRVAVRRLNVAQAALDSLVAETMSREAKLLTPEQRARYFTAMPWGDRPGPRRRNRRKASGAPVSPALRKIRIARGSESTRR